MERDEITGKLFSLFRLHGMDGLSEASIIGEGNCVTDSVGFLKLFVDIENEFRIELNYNAVFTAEERSIGRLADFIRSQVM